MLIILYILIMLNMLIIFFGGTRLGGQLTAGKCVQQRTKPNGQKPELEYEPKLFRGGQHRH